MSKRSFIEIFQKAKKMHVKSVVSAVALTAAMLLSGSAFAQTMIGGIEVSAEDLPGVTARCEELVTAAATEPTAGEPEDSGDNADTTELPADDATPEANGVDQATSKVDLEGITVEQCTEAGLGGAM